MLSTEFLTVVLYHLIYKCIFPSSVINKMSSAVQYFSPSMLVVMDSVRLITYAIQMEVECVDLIID
jgi:hypothetical protein